MEEDHVEEEEEEEDDDDTVMDVAVRMLKKNVALQCMHLDLLFMAVPPQVWNLGLLSVSMSVCLVAEQTVL